MKWMNNTDGKPDAIFTMAVVSFAFVMLKIMLAGTSFVIGGFSLDIGSISAAEITAILGSTLGTYTARRYTDKKFDSNVEVERNRTWSQTKSTTKITVDEKAGRSE